MSYSVKTPKRNIKYENNEYLVESWINGNRNYVRSKFKNMRSDNKGIFLQQAKDTMSSEDYDDLVKGLFI